MSSGEKGKISFKEVDFDPFAEHRGDPVPTTESQREIWTGIQIGGHEANCAYNESVTLTLVGDFDIRGRKPALAARENEHRKQSESGEIDDRALHCGRLKRARENGAR